MTNSARNIRTTSVISASAALLAGVNSVERCGVVLHRSEYTASRHVPVQSPLIGTQDVARVVFVVRLDGGIGSEIVTMDQVLDATAALLQEGDQVNARLVDDLHVESTVSPIFAWSAPTDVSTDAIARGRVLRTGEFLAADGVPSVASLVLVEGARDLVVFVQPQDAEHAARARRYARPIESSERIGVILRRSEYTRHRHVPVNSPLINTKDNRRVVFVIRLDGGIGSEGITIDQTLSPVSALLEEGDQVTVRISGDVHVESTVHPVFAWGDVDGCDGLTEGRVLRSGEFVDSKGVTSLASLVLGNAPGAGLFVVAVAKAASAA